MQRTGVKSPPLMIAVVVGNCMVGKCGVGVFGCLPMTRIPLPSGDCEDTDRCCWKHQQCVVHPYSECGHHKQDTHTVRHCNCESR